jgi:hypothetical protein
VHVCVRACVRTCLHVYACPTYTRAYVFVRPYLDGEGEWVRTCDVSQ